MPTRITRCVTFEAAHQLPWHSGKCRNLHGHHYRLEVTIEGPLDANGVVRDFDEIAAVVQAEIVDRFDHTFLNDLIDNPTAELLAQESWKRLEAVGLPLARIVLWETPDSFVEITDGG